MAEKMSKSNGQGLFRIFKFSEPRTRKTLSYSNHVLGRVFELYRRSNWPTFLSIFAFTLVIKLCFAWRTGIVSGWQDELAWASRAKSSFPETIGSFDAGYPTPLLRALSWILAPTTDESFFVWHLSVIAIIACCIACLSFSKLITRSQILILSGLIATYPSFDLLLLHNLSYWTFIPSIVILTNALYGHLQFNRYISTLFLFLVLISSKPQLLLVLVILISLLLYKKSVETSTSLLMISGPLLLLILGRVSQSAITLDFDFASLVNFLFSATSHMANVVAPIFTLIVYGLSRVTSLPVIQLYFLLCNLLFFLVWVSSRRRNRSFNLPKPFLLIFGVYTSSLYFFANSGWSQDNLLSSPIYTSLFSRHYLPVIFILALAFLHTPRGGTRASGLVLAFAAVQNLAMQIVLYEQFYKPI